MKDLSRVQSILAKFKDLNNVENEYAWYLTNIPRVAPKAYLNVLFKPLDRLAGQAVCRELKLPDRLVQFYKDLNGCEILGGIISIYGLSPSEGWTFPRTPFARRPYDLRELNTELGLLRSPKVCIGRYGYQHCPIVMDRSSNAIEVFADDYLRELSAKWRDFDRWFYGELPRLVELFDDDGNPLAPEASMSHGPGETGEKGQ